MSPEQFCALIREFGEPAPTADQWKMIRDRLATVPRWRPYQKPDKFVAWSAIDRN